MRELNLASSETCLYKQHLHHVEIEKEILCVYITSTEFIAMWFIDLITYEINLKSLFTLLQFTISTDIPAVKLNQVTCSYGLRGIPYISTQSSLTYLFRKECFYLYSTFYQLLLMLCNENGAILSCVWERVIFIRYIK